MGIARYGRDVYGLTGKKNRAGKIIDVAESLTYDEPVTALNNSSDACYGSVAPVIF